tara:strand:+ start:658 stop:2262 length:1605 start_codon:yes stop_codon:yes gene_type:complete
MAIHALWEDRYALSVRKGPLDLAKLSGTGGDSADNVNVASHTNAGAPTSESNADSVEIGGNQHFINRTPGATTQGMQIGQVTSGTTMIFGMPVVGNPGISTGQETIEVEKTDGFATSRVGGANEASNIFRAGQNPTATFDFIATGKSAVHAAALFFQAGMKQAKHAGTTANVAQKRATFPLNTDGSDPLYYGSFLRKISATAANSHLLSDGVGTSLTIRASQTEPLTMGLGLSGRLAVTDFKVGGDSPDIVGGSESTIFGLDGKKNYLLQDSVVTFNDGTNDVALACESFDINCTAEVTPNRFNTFFPLNLVLGNYSVDGSFTIPMLGKGTNAASVTLNKFQDLMADAGVGSGSGVTSTFTPRLLTFGWVSGVTASPGDAVVLKTASTTTTAAYNSTVTAIVLSGDVTATLGSSGVVHATLDSGAETQIEYTATAASGGNTTLTIPSTDFSSDNLGSGNTVTYDAIKTAQDLRISVNAIITDVTVGGDTEATMTISFRGMNQFTAGTDSIVNHAIKFQYTDDNVAKSWGYETHS